MPVSDFPLIKKTKTHTTQPTQRSIFRCLFCPGCHDGVCYCFIKLCPQSLACLLSFLWSLKVLPSLASLLSGCLFLSSFYDGLTFCLTAVDTDQAAFISRNNKKGCSNVCNTVWWIFIFPLLSHLADINFIKVLATGVGCGVWGLQGQQ